MLNLASSDNLRQQAQRYREAAKKLEEAAEIIDGSTVSSASNVPHNGSYGRSERRQQLASLIKEKGPMKRKDIIKALPQDFPKGTLAYLLNQKQYFKSRYHKWDLAQ